jgi:hypothetical protein
MRFTSLDVLEAHALRLGDPTVLALVERWHRATSALARYIDTSAGESLDLVEASTLASLYLETSADASR